MLDEKETKSQDKTICHTQATLLRVLSGSARFSIKDLSDYFRPFKIKTEIQASEAKDFKLFERSEFLKSA